MTGSWSREQVLALSPDASSTSAALKLAVPAPWSDAGADEGAVWGYCKGSGSKPYQAVVDLSGPAFKCSCPSRKFPCKHALALLVLWSAGGVPTAERPDFVREWLESRGARAERSAERAAAGPVDPEARAARAAQRRDRVSAGLEELDVWLCDQIRAGLSGLQSSGYAAFERMAARMVDSQAPGIAGMLRSLPGDLASAEGWPERVLERLAMIHLLVRAHRRLDDLPPGIAEIVRSRVGYPTATEAVTATEPIRDRWLVLGAAEMAEYRLTTRRTWLRGEASGRWGLHLAFAPPGRPLEMPVVPGTTVEADVHFYPGSGQHRVLVGEQHRREQGLPSLAGSTVARAAEEFGSLVSEDPWAERVPAVVRGVVRPPDARGEWWLQDEHGDAVRLLTWLGDPWPLLAMSMGEEIDVFGEWGHRGFMPLSCTSDFTTRVASA